MTTVTAAAPRTRSRTSWRPRLVSAEFLKLRKRRGLVISTFALTVIPMIIGYTVLLSIHAANPAKHGPAGGLENLSGSMDLLSTLSVVAAILVGATLGAGDLGSGVFRELVVTGRSRLALFAARLPAGLALILPFVLAGFAVTAIGSVVFAGSLGAPGAVFLIESGAWLALVTALAGARPRGLLDDRLARHHDRGRAGLADRRCAGVAPDQGAWSSARRARRRRDRPTRTGRALLGEPESVPVDRRGGSRDRCVDSRPAGGGGVADLHARRVRPLAQDAMCFAMWRASRPTPPTFSEVNEYRKSRPTK